MSARPRTTIDTRRNTTLRRTLICQVIAMALFGGGAAHAATTPPAFSPAWFATKQPGATTPKPAQPGDGGGNVGFTPGSALLQQRVQQSIQNVDNAAAAVAAQMQAQKAAQSAAQQLASNVPNGLVEGGLRPAAGIGADPNLWQNANAPTDSVAGTKHIVEVKQTGKKAILTWDSFNVGRDTTLYFNQSGGNQTGGRNDWIALNRVNDPSAKPSQILGQMKAEGTVYLLNRNGVVFGAGAQVDTHALLASSLSLFSDDLKTSNERFLTSGISSQSGNEGILQASFTDGRAHDVVIEKGASITTGEGGFTLIAAPNVTNAGSIVADGGTAILAASQRLSNKAIDGSLNIVDGSSTATEGVVSNTGIVQARRGAIAMHGHDVDQAGVVVASTSISQPGSITLRAANGVDPAEGTAYAGAGTVRLMPGSVTTILPEKDGATTTSSAAADAIFKPGAINLLGGTVRMEGGSLIEAPGADVSLSAVQSAEHRANEGRVYIDRGATIDVSGLANVTLPMSALLVTVPRIGQNELANSPLLRNSFLYTQKSVTLDSTRSGTRADGLDWIGSPILNAAGYVENMPRDVSQLLTRGGNVTLGGNEVIARAGSNIRLDGGYLVYEAGWIDTPNLLGADGRIYDIASANPDMSYVGFAGRFSQDHARWGVTETWHAPVIGGVRRWDPGFVLGADAGKFTVHANDALVLDGWVTAVATPGTRQVRDGTQPRGGELQIDQSPVFLTRKPYIPGMRVQQASLMLDTAAPDFDADTAWDDAWKGYAGKDGDEADPLAWMVVSTDMIADAGFADVSLTSRSSIVETAGTRLAVQPGGSVSLTGPRIDVFGRIEAPAGTIAVTGTERGAFFPRGTGTDDVPASGIVLHDGATLSARGQWVNDTAADAEHLVGSRFIDGGSVHLATYQAFEGGPSGRVDGTGSIDLEHGSTIDVSGGGYVGVDGRVRVAHGQPVGRGGDVSLQTYVVGPSIDFGQALSPAPLVMHGGAIAMDGTIRAEGFSGGGSLTLRAPRILIGDNETAAEDDTLRLASSFFDGQGFDRYTLDAVTDAAIAPDAQVRVLRRNRSGDLDTLRQLGTGADVEAVTRSTLLDPYTRWATRDLREGHGPAFEVSAGDYLRWFGRQLSAVDKPIGIEYEGRDGSVRVGPGASVTTDAGGAISLHSVSTVGVHGTLHAAGGSIDLAIDSPNASLAPRPNAQRVWVGSDALLDASGVALIDPFAVPAPTQRDGAQAARVPRTGVVLDGGTIGLEAATGYVVAEKGARLDVSGAADTFELPVASARFHGAATDLQANGVWSDAGTIAWSAGAGIFSDATLQAHAGAASGEGGTLRITGDNAPTPYTKPTSILVTQSGTAVPEGASEDGAIEAGEPRGQLRFVADSLAGSGITTLELGPVDDVTLPRVPVWFAGDVDLHLDRALLIAAPSLAALRAGATADDTTAYATGTGHVRLSAPYISLQGDAIAASAPVARAGDGTLEFSADTMDMGGALTLQRWAETRFTTLGDTRFTPEAGRGFAETGLPEPGRLFSTGNLTFQAAQLYPTTAYHYAIVANAYGIADANGQVSETTVTVLPGGASYAPLTAGGALLIDADHIEQRGTIRVPSGQLVLGVSDPARAGAEFGIDPAVYALTRTRSVHLAPGSVTSVSLDGLTVPYGTTIDGLEWRYSGTGVATPDLERPPAKEIGIHGDALALDDGATIDLSGGGSLQATEWVPGTGGTRDVLAQFAKAASTLDPNGAPLYHDGRPVFAILPGRQSPVASHDPAFAAQGGEGPGVGQQVYLSGIPGLPAGYYTLLPARYATLPGAFRVVQDTASKDAVLGRSARQNDGTWSVSGYFNDALTGAHDARNTTFLVQSRDVWQQYSQYTLSDADTFFGDKATRAGTVAPRLAADAGRLALDAGSRLDLGAALTAGPGKGGRSSQVDIAAAAIEIVGADRPARDGFLSIGADGLTRLGAGSLLLGGTRRTTDEGDLIDSVADSVVVANDAAHPLAGQEILLVARGSDATGAEGVHVSAGGVVQARGSANPAGSQPVIFGSEAGTDANGNAIAAVDGDGSMLRVSQNGTAAIVRHHVSGIDGAEGRSKGRLAIDGGALVDGGSALTLDGTGSMRVSEAAAFGGTSIDANANRVAFVGDGVDGGDDGLVIGARTLDLFRGARDVTLRSRGDIDFLGDIDVSLDQGLTLNANALVGHGGDVSIRAGRLGLGNTIGAGNDEARAAGPARLDLSADEIDFGPGKVALGGFSQVSATAGSGFAGQGAGGVDFGSTDVDLRAPVFVADSGSDTSLVTTGALRLAATPGTAIAREALGGTLALSGGSVDAGMNVRATAGNLRITATSGDLRVGEGAKLDVAGYDKTFFDTTASAPGGLLALSANHGDVEVAAGSTLAFGGGAKGGNAGSLKVSADGTASLGGTLDGHAAKGFRGGYFTYASGTAADLDGLVDLASRAGATGLLDITSGQGDLTLAANRTAKANKVYLYANGGGIRIDGTIDASSEAGSRIELYGRTRVDVEGQVIATSSLAEQRGGDVVIGTTGTRDANGLVDARYGYEVVHRADAGSIHIGPNARIDVGGGSAATVAGGRISFRAPLLDDGDVPVTIDNASSLTGARDVTIEPYATWSTADGGTGATHFEGIVDPAGWYTRDASGKPVLVAGTWVDASGNRLAPPADDTQLAEYLSKHFFTPDAPNAAHTGFFGYASDGTTPGTLMGFIQSPGFTFGDRFAGIRNVHVRPGIELVNPADATGVDTGAIRVLTNWNLGAGTTDGDGRIRLAYRYGTEAPILTLRAGGDVDIRASISDGFYQQNNGAALSDPPKPPSNDDNGYGDALAAYQAVDQYIVAQGNAWNNGTINLKAGTTATGATPGGGVADISKDPSWAPILAPLTSQSKNYYANYLKYMAEVGTGDTTNRNWLYNFVTANTLAIRKFLIYSPTTLVAPQPGDYAAYGDYVAAYTAWLKLNFKANPVALKSTTPTPLLTPIDPDYVDYTADYATYITGHNTYYKYVMNSVGSSLSGSQLFYAPFAPRGDSADPKYDAALVAYQASLAFLDANNAWNNGTINLKAGTTATGATPGGGVADISKDPNFQPLQAPLKGQSDNYYLNYGQYIAEIGTGDTSNRNWAYNFNNANTLSIRKFLIYSPTTLVAPQPGSYTDYADYVAAYTAWLKANFKNTQVAFKNTTPTPLLTPIDPDYIGYTADYSTYINGHNVYYKYVMNSVGSSLSGSQLFYAPFAPRGNAKSGTDTTVPIPPAAPDNSPSNMPSLGNATSFASATLLGGESSSFRFVAGADLSAVGPLSVRGDAAADVSFDGHFAVMDTLTDPDVVDVRDPFAGKTLLFPTTIRTGTGSIDIASGGDIAWRDVLAPAAIYTAGRPADGTTVDTSVHVVRPVTASPRDARYQTLPDYLVTGAVTPVDGGDLTMSARGDVQGIQSIIDVDGSVTGKKGTDISQYWWQWMQLGNPGDRSRSSINFAAFGQGVMSLGGNVSVNAGGNIGQLSVSLPTTWQANADHTAVTTLGGGNLDVHAGGDILSGAYFVGKGLGTLTARGSVGADPALSQTIALGKTLTSSPVSTVIALQDAQLDIDAVTGADVGGVFDPSLADPRAPLLLAGGVNDGQGYTADSSVGVSSAAGDVVLGSLRAPASLFANNAIEATYLPAYLSLTATGGDVDVRTDGILAPSPDGKLRILASGGVTFAQQVDSAGKYFGLSDAAAALATPFNPARSGIDLTENQSQSTSHDPTPLHGPDHEPVRIYALAGDIADGITAPNGFNYQQLIVMPSKQAMLYAGRDIVNLAFVGQHTRGADISRIAAGRDIYDTAFAPDRSYSVFRNHGYTEAPRLLLGGPGTFLVEAGRDIGPLTNQTELSTFTGTRPAVGIQTVGNLYNTYLPHEGAELNVAFGVGPGVDTEGFLARYLDAPDAADGFGSLTPDLVAFMNAREAGRGVSTGYAKDKPAVSLSAEQARALFDKEPEYVQRLFAEKALFRILAAVGADYNDQSSPFQGQYARGYAAIDALFPGAKGYTQNGAGEGGLNGASSTVSTGNLDIRSTTIQTQQGGDVTIVGPGGQALIGSTAAPSQITDSNGVVISGPNTMGVLTLEQGGINMLMDRSVLLAQSRIFTEQGGDLVIWSSNGDINAGKGAKTTSEVPPLRFICDVDAWCRLDARGQVSGAGIATLQSVPDAPEGSVYLVAPRGTVDAGDAGIRVSGNLVIAAARVANADNIQVQGEAMGIPVVASVNVGALNAASAAANAASQAAEDVARRQQTDARDRQPSIISVNVLRDGDNGASAVDPALTRPVQVLGGGTLGRASASMLTDEERRNLRTH